MDIIKKLLANWSRFAEENPDIQNAVKEGYEVAVYDEETGLVMIQELVGQELKVRIIEEAHVIKKV